MAADIQKLVIAIDGPAGVGKTSVGLAVAQKYGLSFLGTGEMYRCLAWKAFKDGVNLADEEAVFNVAAAIEWGFKRQKDGRLEILVNGFAPGAELMQDDVAQAASKTSALPKARAVITKKQIEMGQEGGLVMEGRDIGTVICPQAPVKIYLTAAPQVRAKRRVLQLEAAGKPADYEAILASVIERDERDSNRPIAPLKPAPDALVIDTSYMDIQTEINKIFKVIDAYVL